MIPSIVIVFKEKSNTVLTRGNRGILGLVLTDTVLKGTSFTVLDGTDIPSTLSAANKAIIESALIGNTTAPKKIECFVLNGATENDYKEACDFIENSKVDVCAFTTVSTDTQTTYVATAIKAMRDNKHRKVMAVLPSHVGDNEGLVNWDGVVYKAGTAVDKEKYCARIAGAIAGTGLTASICNMVLSDVDNCERLTDSEIEEKDEDGKCFAVWDGENVVVQDDRTSLTTTSADKGDAFKTIKLVRDMDMVYGDIYAAIKEGYKGKYTNSYDNQCVLLSAINAYFNNCVSQGLFSLAFAEIDVAKKREWVRTEIVAHPDKFIKKDGTPYVFEDMTDQDIKECYSSNKVFIKGHLGLLDMMKDFDMEVLV